jgi:NtrC-family two-component system sensor histidine kinase KinB
MVSVTPIDTPAGGDPGKVLLLRDVTALKEVDRLKSEFISTASHELRGPLTSVAMSVTLLRESVGERLGDKERGLLSAAEEELQRLRALVNDLLDLSRLESGRLTLAQVALSPTAIVERAVELLRGQADRAGIELRMVLPATLPDVRVDAARITWVLTNLLGNAIRYAGDGGHVDVAATLAGRHVHVSVKDTGPGIPPEDQGRVFERFVRVGPTGDAGGTGLGLAICKEIVRAHGGTIWVESAPGRGSTFTFTLPSVEQGGMS